MGRKKRSSKAKDKAPMASEEPPTDEKAAIKTLLSTPPTNRYVVELYFDNALDNQLVLPVNYFFRHNITSKLIIQGWAHSVFLIELKRVNLEDFKNFMGIFASTHESFPISFSSSSLSIKSRGVKGHSLFLAPVPSEPLLNFHEEFCQMLKETCILNNKDSWVPLCPIGLDVPDDKLVAALQLVFEVKFPLKGNVTSLGLSEFSSKRTSLFYFDLKGSPENA